MDLFETIFSRRSVRKFISKPVEDEKILRILDAARWAPSAGNTQDWFFVVVRDQGRKFQLSEAALGQYWIANASVVIVVCTKPEKTARMYGKKGEEVYTVQNASVAVENVLLAATGLGLGSCWVGSFDEDAVERILKIPHQFKTHAIVPIGYPAEKPNPPHRLGLESFVYFEEYGRTWVRELPSVRQAPGLRRDEDISYL